jgi:hypothetical protein
MATALLFARLFGDVLELRPNVENTFFRFRATASLATSCLLAFARKRVGPVIPIVEASQAFRFVEEPHDTPPSEHRSIDAVH